MERAFPSVTETNYLETREILRVLTEGCRLNLEGWVIGQLNRIAPEPSSESVRELNAWIATYFPKNRLWELPHSTGR
ncbi:MAG: hypothetical protein HQL07_08835 [Nitrospirae bacterium]|nr:hypothetical protein [Magnetococcales bacterium]